MRWGGPFFGDFRVTPWERPIGMPIPAGAPESTLGLWKCARVRRPAFEACLHRNVSPMCPCERLVEIGAAKPLKCLNGFAIGLERRARLCVQLNSIFAEHSHLETSPNLRGDSQAARTFQGE